METGCDDNQNDHKGALQKKKVSPSRKTLQPTALAHLGNATRIPGCIAGKEKESRETDLLQIKANEDVLQGFRVEETSGISLEVLLEDVEEEEFVEHVEQEEGRSGESGDDRRYDSIRQS